MRSFPFFRRLNDSALPPRLVPIGSWLLKAPYWQKVQDQSRTRNPWHIYTNIDRHLLKFKGTQVRNVPLRLTIAMYIFCYFSIFKKTLFHDFRFSLQPVVVLSCGQLQLQLLKSVWTCLVRSKETICSRKTQFMGQMNDNNTALPLDGSRVTETTAAAGERSKRRRRREVLEEPEEGGSPRKESLPGCERAWRTPRRRSLLHLHHLRTTSRRWRGKSSVGAWTR